MADVTEAEVLERLRRVPGPDGAGDLVSLGMIGGLVVKGGHVTFVIQVDPKQGPKLESLRQAAEKAVDAVSGVLSVTAVLTAERIASEVDFFELGTNDLVEANFIDRCRIVMGCVGRLRLNSERGRGFATGFMVAPGLLMTNHHVLPEAVAADATVPPQLVGLAFSAFGMVAGSLIPRERPQPHPGR